MSHDDKALRRAVETLLPEARPSSDSELVAPSPRALHAGPTALRIQFRPDGLYFVDGVTHVAGHSLRELCRYASGVPDRVAASFAAGALQAS